MHTEYYLEHRGSTGGTEHQKFYRITVEGNETHFQWGAIGCHKPGKEDKVHASESEAMAYAETKLRSKKAGKYVLITEQQGNGSTVRTPLTGTPVRTAIIQHEQRPEESGRRFGFEVETHSNLNPKKIADELAARGLRINYRAGAYFHSDGTSWDVKKDGSCGFEFASPILRGDAGIFDVKLALEKIRVVCDTAVNASCGIHVTIDVSDHKESDIIRLCLGYLKAQEHFYAKCNKSRQSNEYCMRNPVTALGALRLLNERTRIGLEPLLRAMTNNRRGTRYHGLNLDNVRASKPRVEFRMLESTLDARKTGAWVRTCVGFVDGLLASQIKFNSAETFSEETFEKIVAGTWVPSRTAATV